MDTKSILITGINGFLGSNLAKALKSDYSILGIEQDQSNLFRLSNESFKIFSSLENLERIFIENSIYAIIHTATIYGRAEETIDHILDSNLVMPAKLFEIANKYEVQYFLNTDSFFNYQNTTYKYLEKYTLSKRHVIEWLKVVQSNTKLINMKIFHMYGPDDSPSKFIIKVIDNLLNSIPELELTNGEQRRDFIYIEDVVEAFRITLNTLPENNLQFLEFEVGTGITHSIKELVTTIADLVKSPSKLLFGKIPTQDGEIMLSAANNSALTELGWKYKNNLKEGCMKTISGYKMQIDSMSRNFC